MSTPEHSPQIGPAKYYFIPRDKPCILLFRGRGFISRAIRWQTRSRYSHAALLLPGGTEIIEAWQFRGVQQRRIDDWEGIDRFDVPSLSPAQWQAVIAHARTLIGKSYDYRGVLRFVSRTPASTDDALFCSELVFDAVDKGAGVRLLHETTAGAVSPAMLALSPLAFKADFAYGLSKGFE